LPFGIFRMHLSDSQSGKDLKISEEPDGDRSKKDRSSYKNPFFGNKPRTHVEQAKPVLYANCHADFFPEKPGVENVEALPRSMM